VCFVNNVDISPSIDSVGVLHYMRGMKRVIRSILVIISMFSAVIALHPTAKSVAETPLIEQKRLSFESALTIVAQQYIGIPIDFGILFERSGAMDNSHLFHLIYSEAAEIAGIRYLGYAPMRGLLERTAEVALDEIRVGDLVVLDNGLVAMIYKLESRDKFHMIYVSRKRQSVISFNSQNVVYEAYWLKYLKGFYRLTPYNYFPSRYPEKKENVSFLKS
jgi:hypothetical protein